MSPRPILLFDVMETLVTEPFYTAIPAFFDLSLDQLLATKHPTSWVEFELGAIDEEEYLRRFFKDGRPVDGAALRDCLSQSYRWIEGMEDLVAELRGAGYEIHALSNYSVWYELIDETLDLSRFLEWTFVSCLTGVRKPDSQAYLSAADHLSVAAADCLFIDDREENVRAALAAGMPAVQIEDAAQVRRELVRRGMLNG